MLDIDEDATPEAIKKKYRQLSLCEVHRQAVDNGCSFHLAVIHPDKTAHERAPEAFDLLKKVISLSFFSLPTESTRPTDISRPNPI